MIAALLTGRAMRMGGGVLQLRGAPVILVVRSVIAACRHASPFAVAMLSQQNRCQSAAIG
jgi:hypothetical protein